MATKSISKSKRTFTKKSAVQKNPESSLKTEGNFASDGKTLRKGKLRSLILVIFLLLIAALVYLSKGLFVAAIVNGKPVSRFAVIRQLEKTAGKQTLDSLITTELIEQEAKKNNIVVADSDVQSEIDKISKNVESQGMTLDAALSAQGMTKLDLEKNVKIQRTVEQLLSNEIQVNDEEIKKYFEDNKDLYGKEAKIEDLKDGIKEQLKQQKLSTEFQTWYEKLKSESNIQYFTSF